MKLYQSKH